MAFPILPDAVQITKVSKVCQIFNDEVLGCQISHYKFSIAEIFGKIYYLNNDFNTEVIHYIENYRFLTDFCNFHVEAFIMKIIIRIRALCG